MRCHSSTAWPSFLLRLVLSCKRSSRVPGAISLLRYRQRMTVPNPIQSNPIQFRSVKSSTIQEPKPTAHSHPPNHPPWSCTTTHRARSFAPSIQQASMKRKQPAGPADCSRKKARPVLDQSTDATHAGVDHPVLRRLYPQVHTLRHYLLSQLPKASKGRRRRLGQLGKPSTANHADTGADLDLGKLLDSVLVATVTKCPDGLAEQRSREREGEVESFTQQRSPDTAAGTFKPGYLLQSEVCCASQDAITFVATHVATDAQALIHTDCGFCHLASVQTIIHTSTHPSALPWVPKMCRRPPSA